MSIIVDNNIIDTYPLYFKKTWYKIVWSIISKIAPPNRGPETVRDDKDPTNEYIFSSYVVGTYLPNEIIGQYCSIR